jgi:hypothetical protein
MLARVLTYQTQALADVNAIRDRGWCQLSYYCHFEILLLCARKEGKSWLLRTKHGLTIRRWRVADTEMNNRVLAHP